MSHAPKYKPRFDNEPVFDHQKPMAIYTYDEPRKWWQFWKMFGGKPIAPIPIKKPGRY